MECLDTLSKMLQWLLDARFEVRVGDVLEAPKKNLLKELANAFKPVRNAKKANDKLEGEVRVCYAGPGLVAGGLQKQSLILIALYHNQQVIGGIVDTRSQVNTISRSCWDKHMSVGAGALVTMDFGFCFRDHVLSHTVYKPGGVTETSHCCLSSYHDLQVSRLYYVIVACPLTTTSRAS
jgi:hypothetical protein